MKKIISIFLLLTSIITSSFGNNTTYLVVDELEVYLQKGITVIDIRSEREWKKTGIIPKSYRLTYINTKKNNNEKKWLYTLIRLIKEKNRRFVLISKSGSKAATLVKKLIKEKKLKNALYLKDGIEAWIEADRKVINY